MPVRRTVRPVLVSRYVILGTAYLSEQAVHIDVCVRCKSEIY